MWPRKQLDIDWGDFVYALRCVASPTCRASRLEELAANWFAADEAVVSLSVRTSWDLLLAALRLPAGSEVLVSGVTIPDMVRIIEHHGLVAVPVSVDPERLEPSLDELERAVTPRTRAVLVAHLFGARVDMEPIVRFAKEHGLFVVEDCAQAFVGSKYAGHDETDCSLFSFGPIKTATALGGAVARVRDAAIRDRMAELQRTYPLQSRWAYSRRLTKYALFRLLSYPSAYGAVVRVYRLLSIDYDRALGNAAHSFSGGDFFAKIRHRPCDALTWMLHRRLATFESRGKPRLLRRTSRGDQLASALPPGMVVGGRNETHTYWVMPLRVANAEEVLAAVRRTRFDATSRSSLVVIRAPAAVADNARCSAPWLGETIFLPNGHDISDSDWERVSQILRHVAKAVPTNVLQDVHEPAAALTVSITS